MADSSRPVVSRVVLDVWTVAGVGAVPVSASPSTAWVGAAVAEAVHATSAEKRTRRGETIWPSGGNGRGRWLGRLYRASNRKDGRARVSQLQRLLWWPDKSFPAVAALKSHVITFSLVSFHFHQ